MQLVGLYADFNLPKGVNGHLSLCASPASGWQPVQGVRCPLPYGSWDRLHLAATLIRISPDNLFSSLHHFLQVFGVHSISVAIQHCYEADQHAVNHTAEKVAEDHRQDTKLPQTPQKV